jgi:hypothetical protein
VEGLQKLRGTVVREVVKAKRTQASAGQSRECLHRLRGVVDRVTSCLTMDGAEVAQRKEFRCGDERLIGKRGKGRLLVA